MVTSERFELTKQDIVKVAKGAAIAGSGVFLTYFLQGISQIDLGGLVSPAIAGLLSILINFLLKFISVNKYAGEKK